MASRSPTPGGWGLSVSLSVCKGPAGWFFEVFLGHGSPHLVLFVFLFFLGCDKSRPCFSLGIRVFRIILWSFSLFLGGVSERSTLIRCPSLLFFSLGIIFSSWFLLKMDDFWFFWPWP